MFSVKDSVWIHIRYYEISIFNKHVKIAYSPLLIYIVNIVRYQHSKELNSLGIVQITLALHEQDKDFNYLLNSMILFVDDIILSYLEAVLFINLIPLYRFRKLSSGFESHIW